MKKSPLKTIVTVLLSLVVTVIVVLLLVPLFYSLDDLKPRIEQMANEKVRGEVKLGHISFALFPNVKVGVENIELHERKNDPAAPFGKIAKIEIRMSLLSLLTSPKATFRLNALDMNIVSSDQKGDTLKNFLLETPAEAPAPVTSPADQSNPLAGAQQQLSVVLSDVPSFVRNRILNARFSFEILDSHLAAKVVTKDSSINADLKGLKFAVLDIGFNSPIQVDSTGVVDIAMDGIKVQGPFGLDGEVVLTPSTGESSSITFKFNKKLDDVAIAAFGLLDKKAGTPLSADIGGSVKFGKIIDANIDTLALQFGGIKTSGSLTLKAEKLEDAVVGLKIQSEKIDLAGLGSLVPMIRDYKLKGETDFHVAIDGPAKNPNLDISAHLSNISGATPQLAKPITGLQGQLNVTGNLQNPLVALKNFSLKIGRSDLSMTMNSEGLEKISAKLNVTSKLLDGDELMGVEPVSAKGKPGAGGTATPAVDPNAPLDEVLDEMAPMVEEALKNPMLDKITLVANLNVKAIRFAGAEYTNATADAKLANRKMTIKTGEMGAYAGHVQADMDLGLKPAILEYSMKAKMDNIQVGEAIKAHAPAWKNAMSGALVGGMTLEGKGLRKAQLAQYLRGHVGGSMKDGRLSLPVMQLVTMFVSKLPKQAGDKLGNQEFAGDFKSMVFDGDIVGRTVKIKKMDVVYDPQKAKIGDLRFNATGELNFDQKINFEAMAFVSPELIRVNELKGPSGLIEIPMKLTGTMVEPKPDIGYTTKILTERFAKGAVKKEIQKLAPKVIDKISEKAPEAVKKQLDQLKKKFKF
ncbi:MAG: AsmA family protein [Bdellovibrionota bacterium]